MPCAVRSLATVGSSGFARLSLSLQKAGQHDSRTAAVDALAACFRDMANDDPHELAAGVVLASGKPLGLSSVSTAGDVGLGARGVLSAAADLCGVDEGELQERTRKAGDIADAVVYLSREQGHGLLSRHALLSPLEVVSAFEQIAGISGRDSTVEKQLILRELLSRCGVEAELLLVLRLALCNSRHGLRGYGLAERSILAALAHALSPASVLISPSDAEDEALLPAERAARRRTLASVAASLQTAFARCPDFGGMCELLLELRHVDGAKMDGAVEGRSEVAADVEAQTEAEPGLEAEAEADGDTEGDTEAEAETETEIDADAEAAGEAEAEEKVETGVARDRTGRDASRLLPDSALVGPNITRVRHREDDVGGHPQGRISRILLPRSLHCDSP